MDISITINNKELLKSSIPSNIDYIDTNIYFDESFTKEKKLELYYKTDFHWNALGTFKATEYILNEIIKNEGYNVNIDISEFNVEYLKERDFLEDLNRRYSYLIEKDDVIPVFTPKDFSLLEYYLKLDNSEKVERNEIIGAGINKKYITYNDIYTENLGFYKVINQNSLTDKKIIIFKDSYQNPTTDFFSNVFMECYIIDLRSFKETENFDELMEIASPDIILFMFHQSNVS